MAILRRHALATALVVCTLVPARQLAAGEVPVGGFLPLVGFGLTDEFLDDLTFF